MEKIPWINHFHKTPDRKWFDVLRVSLGNFLFFTILAIFMIGVKNQKDPRDNMHHGGWMMRVICWCILVILMFFLPNEIVSFYDQNTQAFKEVAIIRHPRIGEYAFGFITSSVTLQLRF